MQAHIELNAIDLAWDTVARFSSLRLPPAFYEDFARVADDESRHFAWCAQRLAELGCSYGEWWFVAVSLWPVNCVGRMAHDKKLPL